jgi:hypothetical protein
MVLLAGILPHTWKSLQSEGATQHVATVLQFPAELLDIAALPELSQLRPLMLLARRGASIGGEARQMVAGHLQVMHAKDALGKVLVLYDTNVAQANNRSSSTRIRSPIMHLCVLLR